jgi:hypothetical protein
MSVNQEKFYFLNWELIPPIEDLLDATQGNEVIEIYIQDLEGCRPPHRYTIPIVQPGQSFRLIRTNLLFEKDKCSRPLKNIFFSVRILRGLEQRLIYTNDSILLAPFYANGSIYRIPIYRVWHWDDYLQWLLTKLFPYI